LFKLIVFQLFFFVSLFAQDCSDLYPEGLPTQPVDKILCKKFFVIGYSYDTKTPLWAVEKLHKDNNRTHHLGLGGFRYKRDYALAKKHRSTSSDYAYSTQDRSQLVPFDDVNTDHTASVETFLMSNIAPQDATLNRNGWIYLARGVRDLANVYGEVHVVTGVAFLNDKNSKVERIGTNKVAVPTHYYKAVYALHTTDGPKMWAWIVPNKAIDYKKMKNYRTTVDNLEKILDINLFPNLEQPFQENVEGKVAPL